MCAHLLLHWVLLIIAYAISALFNRIRLNNFTTSSRPSTFGPSDMLDASDGDVMSRFYGFTLPLGIILGIGIQ